MYCLKISCVTSYICQKIQVKAEINIFPLPRSLSQQSVLSLPKKAVQDPKNISFAPTLVQLDSAFTRYNLFQLPAHSSGEKKYCQGERSISRWRGASPRWRSWRWSTTLEALLDSGSAHPSSPSSRWFRPSPWSAPPLLVSLRHPGLRKDIFSR